METFGEEMEPNLITGPPASRSVIENLKRLLTQRQHSREMESDSDAHKENNGALHSTGSELDQSELSFYSHLTSSSDSDSDDSTDIHIWTAGAAFQLQAANNGHGHGGLGGGLGGGKKKSNGNSTTTTTAPGGGKNGGGRRRRSFRNHSASTSSSSPSPPPSSHHCKRRRKPVSSSTSTTNTTTNITSATTTTPLPLKNIILSKLTPEIGDETTRVTSTNPKNPKSDLSSDDFLSSPVDDETADVTGTTGTVPGSTVDDGSVRKHKNDGNLRKRRREYINAKIRRNEWTEINTPPQTTGVTGDHQNQKKVDDLEIETAMDLSNSSKIRKTDDGHHEPGHDHNDDEPACMVQSQIQIVVTGEKSDEEQIIE